ncbi:hypothetical protein HY642_03800 [Candidatus Woesearchaeota archaeon]|nr:hypothetical protein [Candidatus Woesearchaeota archaeon]
MTLNTLGTPKPGNYDPTLVDRLNKAAEEAARMNATRVAKKPAPDTEASQPTASHAFSIEDHPRYYRVTGARDKYNIYRIDVMKKVVESSKTQDGWIEHASHRRHKRNFHAAPLPLYHALFDALYANANFDQSGLVHEVRHDIMKMLTGQMLWTFTRIAPPSPAEPYWPAVEHWRGGWQNGGLIAQVTHKAIFELDYNTLNSLFGTQMPAPTDSVYGWLSRSFAGPLSGGPGYCIIDNAKCFTSVTIGCSRDKNGCIVVDATQHEGNSYPTLGLRVKKIGDAPCRGECCAKKP